MPCPAARTGAPQNPRRTPGPSTVTSASTAQHAAPGPRQASVAPPWAVVQLPEPATAPGLTQPGPWRGRPGCWGLSAKTPIQPSKRFPCSGPAPHAGRRAGGARSVQLGVCMKHWETTGPAGSGTQLEETEAETSWHSPCPEPRGSCSPARPEAQRSHVSCHPASAHWRARDRGPHTEQTFPLCASLHPFCAHCPPVTELFALGVPKQTPLLPQTRSPAPR